jgi:hypothetical protein
MKTSGLTLVSGTASGEDGERSEVIDSMRVDRAPIGAFE